MAYDAEDCGFQMLNDDEIATSMQEDSDPVVDETDEDEDNNNNDESSKGPPNADAFSASETAMELYEQQSECCPTQLLLLKRIMQQESEGVQCPTKYTVEPSWTLVLLWPLFELLHRALTTIVISQYCRMCPISNPQSPSI
ncbi:hypothetical protein TNCV_633451 [Trichonephila clavipes]|nr:hypothetical protein TNCV_633451 [Trichonephila clavipes]